VRITLDKIASSTRNVTMHHQVVVGDEIPAKPGTVIAVRVLDEKSVYNQIEDIHGRMMTFHAGDLVAGVLGSRRALRGFSGDIPETVRTGDILHLLNLGGVIGRCTSANDDVGAPARVEVLGAVLAFPELGRRVGAPASIFPGTVTLADKLGDVPPVIFVAGSTMHAGKTAAACQLVRQLVRSGLRVGAAKITGVALRRDTLEMLDHGATMASTFADAGLPSTCAGDVVAAGRGCLHAVAKTGVDVIVVELGDGLLGEYGVMDVLRSDITKASVAMVFAANDPVAAWGGVKLLESIGIETTVITGPATDNAAGCDAVSRNTGVPAINARRNPDQLAALVAKVLEAKGHLRLPLTTGVAAIGGVA